MIAAKNEMPPVGKTEGIRKTENINQHFTAHAQRQQDLSVAGQWDLWIAAFGPDVLPAVNDSSLPSSGKLLADETAAGKPESLNKTPSAINSYGHRHRISNWTVTPTEAATLAQRNELQQRCKLDPRHNILLHLRQVRVIDIDVPNDTRAAALSSAVCKALNCEPPMRGRDGTGKVSLFVRVEGNRYMHKAVVNLKPQIDPVFGGETPSAGAIELLGQSQQSLVEGIHPDGSPYFWCGLDLTNGIEAFPLVTEDQMQAAFAALRAEPDAEGPQSLVFGKERPAVPLGAAVQTNDPVGTYLGLKGLVVSDCGDKIHIVCPWQDQHTDGATGSESSTSWLLPRLVDGQLVTRGVFNCKHSHCADRKTQEFLNRIGFGGDRSSTAGFGVLADLSVFAGEPLPDGVLVENTLRPFVAPSGVTVDGNGRITATRVSLEKALRSEGMCHRLGFDTFKHSVMICEPGGTEWRGLKETDVFSVGHCLEGHRFKPPAKELLRDAINAVAELEAFDSAQNWLAGLVWDGLPRVNEFLAKGFGAEPGAYSEAIGLYLWTALAGRIIEPGVKADMVPVAQGPQGIRKSSAVQALCPAPEFFAELDLSVKEDDLNRLMKGRMVLEMGELAGMRAREVEDLKRFVAAQYNVWVEKWATVTTTYARRCIFFGTTNADTFLADSTGSRRWLPFHAGVIGICDPDWIMANRDQLWAEGVALFKANGVLWREAEALARDVHEEFTVQDSWDVLIAKWVDTPGFDGAVPSASYVTTVDVLVKALNMQAGQVNRSAETRVGAVLQRLGFNRVRRRVDGSLRWVYAKS
jgi:hypothetical protein